MSKVIRLTENDIEKLVKKIINEGKTINEDLPEREQERKDTSFRRREFQPYKREKQIQKLFGKYAEDVPPQVIQYLRKIPGTIVKRLVDIYGYDRIENYLHKTLGGPLDESYNTNESYDIDEIVSEAKKSKKWIQKVQKGIEKKGTEGSFKEYCGGEVTMACINKAMKSGDTDLIRKANYAKNIKGYKGAKH